MTPTWQDTIIRDIQETRLDIRELRKEMSLTRSDIATLKVRASLWGFLAGSVPVVLAIIVAVIGKWG